jgi:ubiquinone/menaquinone biosynthesis C-methylase UbiE
MEQTMGTFAEERTKPGVNRDNSEAVCDAWDDIAAGYDSFVTPTHIWLANEGLARIGLAPGMTFLDVAAGSGALSIPAARRGARVVATDLSPAMLDQLKVRAKEEELDIKTRVMDGHALEFEDSTFDLSGSQFGVMLFPDMPRAVSELVRVTKPGGRVLMNVYGEPNKIEFFGFFIKAIQSVVPDFTGPPMEPLPLPFQLKDPETLHQVLADSGLHDVHVDTITEKLEFQSGRQFWNWLVNSNPIVGEVLGELGLSDEDKGVIQDSLEAMIQRRSGGNGIAVLTNPINIGHGTK